MAWAAQAPWLSGQGPTRETAIEDLRKTVTWWLRWMADVFPPAVFANESIVIMPPQHLSDELREPPKVVDEIVTMVDPRHGDTCGLLPSDLNPLSEEDLAEYHTYLRLSRDRLYQTVGPYIRQAHAEILHHIARGEQWYCSRAFPSQNVGSAKDLPEDPLKAIGAARNLLQHCSTNAIGVDANPIEVDGEQWTPRKAHRRALWHELWHTMRME